MSTPIRQPNYVNPDTRVSLILGVNLTTVSLMLLFSFARFYARATIKGGFGADDWCMVMATISALGLSIVGCLSTKYGAGYHIWDTRPEWSIGYWKLGFAIELLFPFSAALAKISLCLTYLRLFPSRANKIFCYSLMTFMTSWLISEIFVSVFQCIPINAFWDLSITDKKCIDARMSHTVFAVLNSLSDFLVYLWPARALWNMQLPLRQRLGLVAVFCTGTIVCVAGILRITTLRIMIQSSDLTYVSAIVWISSVLESDIGIVCGCLQGVKPLLKKLFPRLFSSSGGSSANNRTRTHGSQAFPFHTFTSGTAGKTTISSKNVKTGTGVSIEELEAGREDENNYAHTQRQGKSVAKFEAWVTGGGDPGEVPEHRITFSQRVVVESETSIPEEASATAPIGDSGSEEWIISGNGK